MKVAFKLLILTLALSFSRRGDVLVPTFLGQGDVYTASITSAQSGDWSNTATWTGAVVPVDGDRVTITAGHTVTIVQNVTIGDNSGSSALTINGVFTWGTPL